MRRALVVAASLLVLARCSAFGGDDGSNDPAASAEAGVDAATVDAATSDGGPCGHTFCEDFESFDSSRWKDDGTAQHEISGALGATSGSKALVIAQVDGGVGTDAYYLHKSFQGPVRKVHCSFQYFIDKNPGAYEHPFDITLSGGTNNATYALSLSVRPLADTRPAFLERTNMPNVDYPPVLPAVWSKIEFELPVLRLWLNGVEVGVADAGVPEPTGPFATALFRVGCGTISGNDGWRVAVDDVQCDVE